MINYQFSYQQNTTLLGFSKIEFPIFPLSYDMVKLANNLKTTYGGNEW